jgi:hypothetical protein
MVPSFPSSRGISACPRYTVDGKMSDKNLQQRINIKFCVNSGKSASEMLVLLTLGYGKYARMKSSSRNSDEMLKMIHEVAIKDTNDRCKYGQSTNLGALRLKIGCKTTSRGI